MARSSPLQRSAMGRVMREYKQGELKSGRMGRGGRVKKRKQAIAIALHEAGLSKYDTKTERKRAVAKLKRKVKATRAKRKVARTAAALRAMGGKNATKRARMGRAVRKTARKTMRRARVGRAVRGMRGNGMGD